MERLPKPVRWVGTSRRDMKVFPRQVRGGMGYALYAAQMGETDPAAKPLKGFGGAKVMEIVDRYQTNTYRAVYTAQFGDAVYVLHAFQKKIEARHRDAEKRYRPDSAAARRGATGP